VVLDRFSSAAHVKSFCQFQSANLFAGKLMRPRTVVILKRLVNPRAVGQKFDEVIRVEHRHAFFPDDGGFDVSEVRVARRQLLLDDV